MGGIRIEKFEFITNMVQYAIQGNEISALDYVLKPIEYFAFSQEMEKVLKRLKMSEGCEECPAKSCHSQRR